MVFTTEVLYNFSDYLKCYVVAAYLFQNSNPYFSPDFKVNATLKKAIFFRWICYPE
jgi:hypothetical protein